MATKTKITAAALAEKFVNCKMNCNLEHNPTRILKLIGPKYNDIPSLRKYFVEQKKRLDKEGKYEFERWYTKDVISILDKLIKAVKEEEPTGHPVNDVIGAMIVNALKNGGMFRKFNWNNYQTLVAEDLFSLFTEFDTDFRGDIVACHKVGGKYVVIETERHPFDYDNQRYKTREPKEKQFYSTEFRGKKPFQALCMTNTVFNTFEAALFHTMNPHQYSAMNILFESKND